MLRMKTDQEYPVSYKPHHMLIYIYGRKDSEPYGEVASFYLKETKKFQNVGEMVLMLDEIARSLDCSESRDKSCFAGMETAENSPDNLTECMDQTEQNNIKTLLTYRRTAGVSRTAKAKELLVIDIEGRHCESLQGKLRGNLTKWQYRGFRSGLELMHIFYEMLSEYF